MKWRNWSDLEGQCHLWWSGFLPHRVQWELQDGEGWAVRADHSLHQNHPAQIDYKRKTNQKTKQHSRISFLSLQYWRPQAMLLPLLTLRADGANPSSAFHSKTQQHTQALTKKPITKASQSLDLNQLVQIFSCSLWLDSRLSLPDYFSLEKKKKRRKERSDSVMREQQCWAQGATVSPQFFWVSECPAVNKNNQRLLKIEGDSFAIWTIYGMLSGRVKFGRCSWTLLTVVVINELSWAFGTIKLFCSVSCRDLGFPGHPMGL